ncbi:MAG: MarR family transcriptional regulator [Clostridia bacterium]|nr:MarR family transcriptional regulator [Clostridia bacterium]
MDKPIAGYGWFIKRIDNALEKEANGNLQALNLTMQQNRALILLAHADEHTLTLKELEERFGAAQSTVAGLISRLEKKGLVEGTTDPADRRVKRVRLTDEGMKLHLTSRQNIIASEERLTSLLSEDEKQMLLVCLRKVYEAVK